MKQYRNLIKPYLVWAFVVIVIPLILIALYAFTEDGNEVLTFSFTLENFRKFLEATYMSVIFKSFKLGILTTVICLGLGYPLAYIISKCPEKSQSLLILLVTIPEWINMLLRTYAWMNLLSDNGIINHLLGLLGISPVLRSLSTRRKLRKNMVKQQIQGYLFNKSTKYGERRCA